MLKQKSILVTGSNGQLGQSFQAISTLYPSCQFTFSTRKDIDLNSSESINNYFQKRYFDLIINCAAYTAVDKAEQESGLADAINHTGVNKIAQIAKDKNIILVHISTDYVFDGTNYRPYIETDLTNPQSVYGVTKLKGEQVIQKIKPQGCIIRTSWVYSEFSNNFVKTMMKLGRDRNQLGVIFDQIGSPTYANDLAEAIMVIVQSEQLGNASEPEVYHYSNEGVCSWYDFAMTIFEISKIDCEVTAIETKEYPTPAKRPHYSLLNKAKIKQDYALTIPYWKNALVRCLDILKDEKTQ